MKLTATQPTVAQCLERSKLMLDEVSRQILCKGYYRSPNPSEWGMKWNHVIISEVTFRLLARKIAKEAKRPFVHVSTLYKYNPFSNETCKNGIRIEMPKLKYLSPIINPLELAGFKRNPYKGLWSYNVDNNEFAKEYLSFFETREEFRHALKLPV